MLFLQTCRILSQRHAAWQFALIQASLGRIFVICALFYALALATAASATNSTSVTPPPLNSPPAQMLATSYRAGAFVVADYWVSEKLDGVRGYWDGEHLRTRSGAKIYAPIWFTANWPPQLMDGELWIGRNSFAETVSTVRMQTPDDAKWRKIQFMVFDMPASATAEDATKNATFTQRLHALQKHLDTIAIPWLKAVPQFKVADEAALQNLLQKTVKAGGEGLMLHRGDARHQAARSTDLLKLKLHADAEAKIIGYSPGKGKYTGMVGALKVQTGEGVQFKLGSGLSDAQRQTPPPLGAWVTYRYRDITAKGVPRFATFLRVREDMDLQN